MVWLKIQVLPDIGFVELPSCVETVEKELSV